MSQKEELAKLAENYGLGQDIKMEPRVWKFRPEQRSMRALEAAFKLGEQASRVAALAEAEKIAEDYNGDPQTAYGQGVLDTAKGIAAAIRSRAEAPTK